VVHKRRDKRSGHHVGRVIRAAEGSPCIEVTWGNPYGGECRDTFCLSEDGGTLEQITDMVILSSGRHTTYKTVYRRVHER